MATAFGLIAPALGISKSPIRATTKENVVNVAAHLLYGTAIALVTGELGLQVAGHGADPQSPSPGRLNALVDKAPACASSSAPWRDAL